MNWIYNHRKLIAVIAVAVLVLLALPHLWNLDVSDVLSYTPASPILAALVLLGFYCLKSITMVLPIVVLYISAGILFPPAWAVLITYICLICEMSIGYWMGKTMGHPDIYIIVSFGLSYRLESPRIVEVAEPYPNRWTHHVIIQDKNEIDLELVNWIKEAYQFAMSK